MKSKSLNGIVAGMALALALAGCQASTTTEALSGVVKASTEPAGTWNGPQSGLLAPFKEQAFRYRKPLEVSDGGRYMRVPYDELKDINARDEVPVRKVKTWWVRKLPKGAEVEREYVAGGRTHKYLGVGALDGGSKMTVIYIHGRGGSRLWGFDDERFGGNFNRLKNMMIAAGGAYVSPDFTDFESEGFADVKALILKFRPLTTGKLVVACGSMGNFHCWNIAQDAALARAVDGIIVLAGFPDDRFLSSVAVRSNPIPLVISHGSWDPDYKYEPTLAFYRKLRQAAPGYPVRYILFDTGKHGAPVRMIDWRDTLNWIASK